MAITRNFIVNRGHSFSTAIVLKNGDKAYNLNNCSLVCVAKEGYFHDFYKIYAKVDIVDASNGIIRLSLSPGDTVGVKVPKLVYTLSLKNNTTGSVDDLMEGVFIMNQTATMNIEWGDFEPVEESTGSGEESNDGTETGNSTEDTGSEGNTSGNEEHPS